MKKLNTGLMKTKTFLLGLPWLWKSKITMSFDRSSLKTSSDSWMGGVEAIHRLYGDHYYFAFYWYPNTKGIPASYKMLGSYRLTDLRQNAVRESIKLSNPKSHDSKPRSKPAPDLSIYAVNPPGWRSLVERAGVAE